MRDLECCCQFMIFSRRVLSQLCQDVSCDQCDHHHHWAPDAHPGGPGGGADPQRVVAGRVPIQLHQRPLAAVSVVAGDGPHHRPGAEINILHEEDSDYELDVLRSNNLSIIEMNLSNKISGSLFPTWWSGRAPPRWCAAAAPHASSAGASGPATRSHRSSSTSCPAEPSPLKLV